MKVMLNALRIVKPVTVVVLLGASALTVKATVVARRACWGDIEPLPAGTVTTPESFQKVAEPSDEKKISNHSAGELLSQLLVDVSDTEYMISIADLQIHDFVTTDHHGALVSAESWYVTSPSSCSGDKLYYHGGDMVYYPGARSRPDALWYDPTRDIYRLSGSWKPEDKGAFDFRRIARPGYTL
jgi:hypothetical protein